MSKIKDLEEAKQNEYMEEMDMEYERLKGEAIEAETMYWAQKAVMDEAKKAMDAAKATMVELDAKGIEFRECYVDHRSRKGSFDMKKLQRELNMTDEELDAYRKADVKMVYIEKKK